MRLRVQVWVTMETCALIDQRDAAKIRYEATHKKDPARTQRKAEWDQLAAATTAALLADEMKSLENEIQAMQAAALNGHPKTAWDLIKKISGKQRKPPVKVKSKVKTNATEKELLNEWRSYFKELLNAPVNPDTLTSTAVKLQPKSASTPSPETKSWPQWSNLKPTKLQEATK